MEAHRFQAFAAYCARRLERTRRPEIRERILRELNDWLGLAERRRRAAESAEPRAFGPPRRSDPAAYEVRLIGSRAAGSRAEPVAAQSDEAAIAQAIRRLKDAAAVELWSGDRWVCRCEQGPTARKAD
jgi:hypothetical protein